MIRGLFTLLEKGKCDTTGEEGEESLGIFRLHYLRVVGKLCCKFLKVIFRCMIKKKVTGNRQEVILDHLTAYCGSMASSTDNGTAGDAVYPDFSMALNEVHGNFKGKKAVTETE